MQPPFQPCGYRLDQVVDTGAEHRPGDESFRLQRRLLALLGPDQPPEVINVGRLTAPDGYFVDLRIIAVLLQASWPAGRDLVHPAGANLVDHHVQQARDQIATARETGRKLPLMRVYDKPPLDAAATATLLGAAGRIGRVSLNWPRCNS